MLSAPDQHRQPQPVRLSCSAKFPLWSDNHLYHKGYAKYYCGSLHTFVVFFCINPSTPFRQLQDHPPEQTREMNFVPVSASDPVMAMLYFTSIYRIANSRKPPEMCIVFRRVILLLRVPVDIFLWPHFRFLTYRHWVHFDYSRRVALIVFMCF